MRDYARQNRLAPTTGEKAMCDYLRSFRPYGARFRRQAPIGSYIADFAWLSARIVVEVDGATHDNEKNLERDKRKDSFLRGEGFTVFRVNDNEIIANSLEAVAKIDAAIRGSLSTPPQPRGRGSIEQR